MSDLSHQEANSKGLGHWQRELFSLVARGLTGEEIAAQRQANDQLPANLAPIRDNLVNED
jgi:DNA-binding NarL/FixJ family response regulator